jgi:hypothetical protein
MTTIDPELCVSKFIYFSFDCLLMKSQHDVKEFLLVPHNNVTESTKL